MEITKYLFQRLEKVIPIQEIDPAVRIIISKLIEEILTNGFISVKNFGTFTLYLIPEHNGWDPNTKQVILKKATYTVKFHPNINFQRLINSKKKKFKPKKVDK